MSGYSDLAYWEDRYRLDVEPLEWYQPFSTLRPFIAPLLVLHPAQTPTTSAAPTPFALTRELRHHHSDSRDAGTPTLNHRSSLTLPNRRSSLVSLPPPSKPPNPISTPQSDSRSLTRGRGPAHDPPPPPLPRTPSLGHGLSPHPPTPSVTDRLRVLVLGCGLSSTPLDVYRLAEGRAEVVAVDFSAHCIEECRRRWPDSPGPQFLCADLRALELPPDHFDLVVDKAALDCLRTAEGEAGDEAEVRAAVAGLHRLLKVDGALLSLSHSPPDQRVAAFRLEALDVWREALVQDKRERERQRAQTTQPAPGSRRASELVNQVAALRPTPSFSQPVVHRIAKQPVTRPTTVSVTRGREGQGEDGDGGTEGEEEEDETGLSLDAMEEAEHYLYIVTKAAQMEALPM